MVVVRRYDATAILAAAQKLLRTEHVVQEKIKAGATIGELIRIDEVFASVFAYQERAARSKGDP